MRVTICAAAVVLFSATQDIAIDAYAVEVLRREEHGTAAGARTHDISGQNIPVFSVRELL